MLLRLYRSNESFSIQYIRAKGKGLREIMQRYDSNIMVVVRISRCRYDGPSHSLA